MFKSVVFLKFFATLLQGIAIAFQPVTENNHVLVGHVFQQLHARDWFNCIQACHDEPRCISYNYERSADANGLCELILTVELETCTTEISPSSSRRASCFSRLGKERLV